VTKRNLAEWLDYQQSVHAVGIDLGLDRVSQVWNRMGAPTIASVVITVGGTNGKGSTVAFLEAMLLAAGKQVGCYTSPHLLHYNERVRVDGRDLDDARLIDAFERIEVARETIPLTYFEFGTLAALWIFAQSKLDVAVLEVGLGGRLDAVNIVDADASIVTTIDLDHQDWLGNDREAIGHEKAGIFRADRPAVIGEIDPPKSLVAYADRIGARTLIAGRDFSVVAKNSGMEFRLSENGVETVHMDLPSPSLAAPSQPNNAAAAIAALYTVRDRLGWFPRAIAEGIRSARVAARLQQIDRAGHAALIVDVAHNPQAARILAQWLQENPNEGRTFAVFGALSDKDVAGIVQPLADHVAHWFLAGLDADTPRGISPADLGERVSPFVPATDISLHPSVATALDAAAARACANDRIIAFGSFFVAASALSWIEKQSHPIQREAPPPQV
jgi:dihydrofolate synthase / folylpolyglutamate synthase